VESLVLLEEGSLMKTIIAMAIVGLALAMPGAANAHPTDLYISPGVCKHRLVVDDVYVGGSYRDIVRASCLAQPGSRFTGRDYIWNSSRTKRLFRHFVAFYTFSNAAVWGSVFHVLGEYDDGTVRWTLSKSELIRPCNGCGGRP
jgi:hypothetical protein